MKNIVIIDIETTGLSPLTDKIIEIGALLFNIEHKIVLQTCSFFLPCNNNPVEHINNIKAEWTSKHRSHSGGILMLRNMIKQADAIIAHNAKFDKGFLLEIPYLKKVLSSATWLCTKDNFKWPVALPRKRLQDICSSMGVDYVGAHRSISDCEFLAKCFSKVDDLQARLEDSLLRI